MGKKMDLYVFSGLAFLGVLIALRLSGKDDRIVFVLSAISAVCVYVILKSVFRNRKERSRRKKRADPSNAVKQLIYMEHVKALQEIIALLQKKYLISEVRLEEERMYFKEGTKEEAYELSVIRKFKASPDDVLAIWREHRKKRPLGGIVFAIPGKMDSDVKLLRYKMDEPKVLILDKSALKALYKKYGEKQEGEKVEKSVSVLNVLKSAVNRKRALRYLSYALLLMGYYLLSGNRLYLIIGAFLLFVCLFSFFSNAGYERLF